MGVSSSGNELLGPGPGQVRGRHIHFDYAQCADDAVSLSKDTA